MGEKFRAPTKVNVEYKSARNYYVSWNKGMSKYDSQTIEWGYTGTGGKKIGSKKLKGTDDHETIDLGFNPFPHSESAKKVGSVYAIITGKKGKSSGSKKGSFDIKKPKKLGKIKAEKSNDESDVVYFTIPAAKTDKDQPVEDIEYDRIFVKDLRDDSEATLKKQKWTSANGLVSKTGISKNGKEVSFKHAQQTVYGMMCFRARARNTQGACEDWTYASFPWSRTNTSQNVDTKPDKVKVNDEKQVMSGTIKWSFSSNDLKEIDYISVEYYIGIPRAGLKPPLNPDWKTYSTPSGSSAKKVNGSLEWALPVLLEDDQCLWWRVNSYPPSGLAPKYGNPMLTRVGKLAAPTLTGFTPDPETHIIEITATNNSQVEDSMIAVVYNGSHSTGLLNQEDTELDGKIIGFIPHGESTVEIKVPDWGERSIGIEIYAVAGASFTECSTVSGYTYYELTEYSDVVSADFIYDQPWDSNYCTITVPYIKDFDDEDLRQKLKVTFKADVSDGAKAITGHSPVYSSKFGDPYPTQLGILKWVKYFTIYTKGNRGTDSSIPNLNKNQVFLKRNNNLLEGSTQTLTKGYVCYVDPDYWNSSINYMTSDRKSDSESVSVPKAPENLAGVQIDNETIIQVTWDMNWEEAAGTEISWADHKDAWYSTSGPNTYDVDNIRSPKLNISDAALGTTWYIRARFYKDIGGGNRIYGPYSDVNDGNGISTASSPNIPALKLSDDTIPDTGYVTASWVYVTNDTTLQESATLGEIVEENGTETIKEFDNISITTEQRITLYASDMGWENGTSHKLVVKVRSVSGMDSGWSDPEDLTIAPKLNCQITQTSLDYVDTVTNPTTYTGSSVTFQGTGENGLKDIYHLIVDIDPIEEDNKYVSQSETVVTINGYQYTVNWSNYTSAFYGGTLDLPTGELTNLYNRDKSSTSELIKLNKEYISILPGENTISASTGNVSVTIADSFKRGYFLKEMPLTVTATGAGEAGETYYIIERQSDCQMLRPNNVTTLGPIGEVVYRENFKGETQNTITTDNLVSYLDDGAEYRLRAVIFDNAGQTDEDFITFTVDWTHQAFDPDDYPYGTATVQNGVGIITLNTIFGTVSGDHIDIYRLSADKPELIYNGAQFGETYVDPYPTIGKEGGYRLVFVTCNGDYITSEKVLAWQDISTDFKTKFQLIDFGAYEVEFKYNISLDNSWKKKFTQTNYLGGSTQGDWDAGTNFETSVSGNTFYDIEPEVYEAMRVLADYSGICHLRTIDGSNICCNIEVSDNSTFNSLEHQHDISLSIQKVDNPELDGMPYSEWSTEEE